MFLEREVMVYRLYHVCATYIFPTFFKSGSCRFIRGCFSALISICCVIVLIYTASKFFGCWKCPYFALPSFSCRHLSVKRYVFHYRVKVAPAAVFFFLSIFFLQCFCSQSINHSKHARLRKWPFKVSCHVTGDFF